IPALEDIYDHSRDVIFTSASYDDEGAVADFTNLETTMNVSLIPTQGYTSFILQHKFLEIQPQQFKLGANVKTASTHIETKKPLVKDKEAANVDVHFYRSMIGSLMYLTYSRPDIMYLKGQPKLGLWYPRESAFDLEAYSDSNYTEANLDRKSTIGGCQFLGKPVVITEASIRSDLLFNDVDGIDCLTNEAIFEYLALMGYEGDLTKLTFQKALFSSQWKFMIHTIIYFLSSKSGHTSGRAEGILNLEELYALCTNLSNRVLALETVKDAQDKEILTLKARIKKLEKRCVAFKDLEDTNRPARSILTLKPLPTIDPKDKGKGVLEEPESEKKMTKSDFDATQIARDEEIARQLEVELQAKEKYNVVKRAKLLVEYFERRKKQLAEERADAIRNKPPTKTQLISLMTTYLINMGRFCSIGSEEDERRIRDINKKDEEESNDKGVDNTKKRKAGSRMKMMSKRIRDINKKDEEESNYKGVDNTKKRKAGSRMKMMSKSAFLYGTIDEEVYVMQPPGFQDLEFPDRVYKVKKAMYGLHQTSRAWYGTLSKYLLDNSF
nr:hypothetical protein [Tanacetum cinerariifolium]